MVSEDERTPTVRRGRGRRVRPAATAVALASLFAGPMSPAGAELDEWIDVVGINGAEVTSPDLAGRGDWGRRIVVGDFDGDGFDDVVGQTVTVQSGGASVVILRGGPSGPSAGSAIVVEPTDVGADRSSGLDGALAVGDFNGDGLDDLAVAELDGQRVHVIPGSPNGPAIAASAWVSQDGPVPGISEAGDRFGAALATGDFDDDGFDDLAVGVPGEAISRNRIRNAGVVSVIYGSGAGLDESRSHGLNQAGPIRGKPESGDGFGSVLAAGDFNGDGADDLAVGVPDESLGGDDRAGAVNVIYGTSGAGLTPAGNVMLNQAGPVPGTPEVGDRFGNALAAGDIGGDGFEDLAVGVADERLGRIQRQPDGSQTPGQGAVAVFWGQVDGLRETRTTTVNQRGEVPGRADPGDRFGWSLVIADFDGNGRGDLAVGAPDVAVRVGGVDYQSTGGDVVVFDGRNRRLQAIDARAFDQGSGNIPGIAEAGDGFGWSVAAGDLRGDRRTDLVIGVPGEDVGGLAEVGAVQVIPGVEFVSAAGAIRLNVPPEGQRDSFASHFVSDGAVVVYVDHDSDHQVFAVDVGGGVPRHLSAGVGLDTQDPVLVPERELVVFASRDHQNLTGLWVAPLSGGVAPVELTGGLVTNGSVRSFRATADGERVVFTADREVEGQVELYSVPTTGGAVAKISADLAVGADVVDFVLDPSGSNVVYRSDQDIDGVVELYSTSVSGGPVAKLNGPITAGGAVRGGVQITPDGTTVVYRADETTDEAVELYAAAIDGTSPRRRLSGALTPGSAIRTRFVISPDSARVVYRGDELAAGTDELFSVALADGTSVRLNDDLPAGGDVRRQFEITSDSARVIYLAEQEVDNKRELYSVPIAGGSVVRLNRDIGDSSDVPADWVVTPDGTAVGYWHSVSRDPRTNLPIEDIFAVPTAGGPSTRITRNNRTASGLMITPDGANWVFVDRGGEGPRVVAAPRHGGSASVLADFAPPVDDDNATVRQIEIGPNSRTVIIRAELGEDGGVMNIYSAQLEPS